MKFVNCATLSGKATSSTGTQTFEDKYHVSRGRFESWSVTIVRTWTAKGNSTAAAMLPTWLSQTNEIMGWLLKTALVACFHLKALADQVTVNLPSSAFIRGIGYDITWWWDWSDEAGEHLSYEILLCQASNNTSCTSLVRGNGNPGYYLWTVPDDLEIDEIWVINVWVGEEWGWSEEFTIYSNSTAYQPSTLQGKPASSSTTFESHTITSSREPPRKPSVRTSSTTGSYLHLPAQQTNRTTTSQSPAESSSNTSNNTQQKLSAASLVRYVIVAAGTIGAAALGLLAMVSFHKFQLRWKARQRWQHGCQTPSMRRDHSDSPTNAHLLSSASTETSEYQIATPRQSNSLEPFSAEELSSYISNMAVPLQVYEMPAEVDIAVLNSPIDASEGHEEAR